MIRVKFNLDKGHFITVPLRASTERERVTVIPSLWPLVVPTVTLREVLKFQ